MPERGRLEVVAIEVRDGCVAHVELITQGWSVHRHVTDAGTSEYRTKGSSAIGALNRIGVQPAGFGEGGDPVIAPADVLRIVDAVIDRSKHEV